MTRSEDKDEMEEVEKVEERVDGFQKVEESIRIDEFDRVEDKNLDCSMEDVEDFEDEVAANPIQN